MLIRIILLILLLLLPAAAQAQPHIAVDAEVYDFGIINGSPLLEHTFKIYNEGTEDLIIGKLDAP